MLYPILTETRNVIDLNGIWKFYLDDDTKKIDVTQPLETEDVIAVPGSFNDQAIFSEIRNHAGTVWYEREFTVPKSIQDERLVLRFGSPYQLSLRFLIAIESLRLPYQLLRFPLSSSI